MQATLQEAGGKNTYLDIYFNLYSSNTCVTQMQKLLGIVVKLNTSAQCLSCT